MAQTVETPKVTVLMPVYNGEKYLKEAIESILKQTFKDFEFLIINDGSSDGSLAIIESYTDSHIRLVHNEKNLGLVESLNKGIALSTGDYIARMDCDDVSLPQRLEKQVEFLDKNPHVSVVASHIQFINADGELTGYWDNDMKANTRQEIYSLLPKSNCIAHPTSVMRKAVSGNYLYRKTQKHTEDWDVWMRMAADGRIIEKINEILLLYRIHFESVTMFGNTGKISQKKTISCKRRFLLYQLSKLKINKFFFSVVYSWLRGIGRYWKLYIIPDILRGIKRILTSNPFKVYSDFIKLKKYLGSHSHNLIFFFSYAHVGGAERVHSEIVSCVADKNPLVFFTGYSVNKVFLPLFQKNAKVFNIPYVLNYPLTGKKAKRVILDYITYGENMKLLGCNSLFYYELVEMLPDTAFCADLKHSFIYPSSKTERELLPAVMGLNRRVFISKFAIENLEKFYYENNVPHSFLQKVIHINNFVNTSPTLRAKRRAENLNIIYVGRDSPEKRLHLIFKIAEQCSKENLKVKFQLIGKINQAKYNVRKLAIDFTGEITDENELRNKYAAADILLITSDTEGLPMAITEAMANGVVPISTKVGDVPLHVKNNETGFVTTSNDEAVVLQEMTEYIKLLYHDRTLLETISEKSYTYAKTNFTHSAFCNSYRKLLEL